MGMEQRQQLAPESLLGLHRVGQVGPVETGQENPAPLQPQLLNNILPHPIGGRGRQGNYRHPWKIAPQLAQVAVVRAELVPPLRNTVCLVHRDQVQVHALQETPEPGHRQPLRGRVQDLDPAPAGLSLGQFNFRRRQRTVDETGRDAVGIQRIHLVLHQRNQRRHHQGHPRQAHRGQLVAQRLASPRGHQHQSVLSRQDVGNYLLLKGQKTVVAKVGFQYIPGGRLVVGQQNLSSIDWLRLGRQGYDKAWKMFKKDCRIPR